MAKNADDKPAEGQSGEDKPVTDEDLKKLKEDSKEVEPSKADEPEETDTSDEDSEDTDADSQEEEAPTFTKKFPNIKGDTPEEYLANLEDTYDNSFGEGLRLHKENQDLKAKLEAADEDPDNPAPPKSAAELYAEQKLNEEMAEAFSEVSKDYPQIKEQSVYDSFVKEVEVLTNTIYTSQGRLAPPKELYSKAAIILGLEKNSPTEEDKLKDKLKEGASTTKTTSSTKPSTKSKVTDSEVAMFRKLNPDSELSDTEIRKELEPHK